VAWSSALTGQVDYEAELAVIIGRRARQVTPREALRHVLGYTCLNDVSARDLQVSDGQWTRAKSLDTFCPIGPWVVTADEIPDPGALRVQCRVNGELRQDASTASLVHRVADLIAYCSRSFTLEPGDVIATGTPGGVGAFREPPVFLADGDTVEVEIERIGILRNRCRVLP
jgi:2-keto-4-pentenoate hydratase/2-oxohepta-3-ene-1,7-dioic acid hydratase in catechol pathway